MASAAKRQTQGSHPANQGAVSRALSTSANVLAWLFVALVFSIISEWVGMWLWWPDEGVDHSRRMLDNEIGYINQDFSRSILVSEPALYAARFAEQSYRVLFEWTRIHDLVIWLNQPVDLQGGRMQAGLRSGFAVISDHVIAAMTITQLFFLRLAVLTLALPVFVLFGLAALVDGLAQRDLRRWGGARESSFLYHHAKRTVLPSMVLPWVVYLGLPVSIHPNFVILPFAVITAVSIAVTARTFKKYL